MIILVDWGLNSGKIREDAQDMNYNSKYAHSAVLSSWFEKYLFGAVQKYLDVREGETVLEVGCNRGSIVKRMQNIGARVYGIDINSEAIADGVAENLQVMDATELKFPNAMFDKVYSLHTIEHIPDIKKTLREMERVLKPGGRLVLTYPTEPGFLQGFFCLYHAVVVYKNPFFARKIHVHSLNPNKIQKLTGDTSLEYVESPFPVRFYPQYLTVLQKKAIRSFAEPAKESTRLSTQNA